jgi:uncharacterized protein (TIGR03118 family)
MTRLSPLLCVALASIAALGIPAAASAQFYAQHNLVSDGAVPADHSNDTDLVNAWGLAASSTSPWWVADNQTNKSTLYNGNTGAKQGLVVSVPGNPTGVVFNAGTGFVIPGHSKAAFIFDGEDGAISGWPGSGTAVFSFPITPPAGSVYKGLAFAHTNNGDFIYATNFHEGTVDVWNGSFAPITGGFADPTIPAGYAPFGIQNIGGTIYVTYALQDAAAHDDVPGVGHGYVNAFDVAGNLLHRVASKGPLNSPWGLALAPASFGKFGGDLLVGNFGDGRIHAFDMKLEGNGENRQDGPLHSTEGRPIEIDGLWSLQFGNGGSAGPTGTLFFTAGPFDEQHGLFGTLTPAGPPGHDK